MGLSLGVETWSSESRSQADDELQSRALLVMMTEETSDPKYEQAAIRAAISLASWGPGIFIGGASDNRISPTKRRDAQHGSFPKPLRRDQGTKWLNAPRPRGFAESWILIWNLPMPLDADDAELHWKKACRRGLQA